MKEEQKSSWQATQESAAGRTRTTAEKGGGYRVGYRLRPTWRVPYPRRPCLSGFFLVTSSWMGSRTALPARYFLHELVTGGTSHNSSQHHRTPGLLVHHQVPESTQTHVYLGSDAIQPSHPLSSPSPPALNLSQHQGLFK